MNLLGTWFLVGGFSKMRFCPDETWHERAGCFYLHGSYTLTGDVLTLVTHEKRWRTPNMPCKEVVRYQEFIALETRIAHLDEKDLRFEGAVRHSPSGTSRDGKKVSYSRSDKRRTQPAATPSGV